jgi:hypothetical protein
MQVQNGGTSFGCAYPMFSYFIGRDQDMATEGVGIDPVMAHVIQIARHINPPSFACEYIV